MIQHTARHAAARTSRRTAVRGGVVALLVAVAVAVPNPAVADEVPTTAATHTSADAGATVTPEPVMAGGSSWAW